MKMLLETITNKAKASYGKEVTMDVFEDWVQHWLKTGDEWASELEKEGLVLTPKAIRERVAQQREYCEHYLKKPTTVLNGSDPKSSATS